MATGPVFSLEELIAKLPARQEIKASTTLKGLIKIESRGIEEAQIKQKFAAAINRASQRITQDLKAALDGALRSEVWSSPGGVADIYETGELLASGTVTADGSGIRVAYDAPYASLVHFGGYINPYGNTSTKIYLPPRPWVQSVMQGGGPVPQFNFAKYYIEEITAEFGR